MKYTFSSNAVAETGKTKDIVDWEVSEELTVYHNEWNANSTPFSVLPQE